MTAFARGRLTNCFGSGLIAAAAIVMVGDVRPTMAQTPSAIGAPGNTTFFGLTPQFAVSPNGQEVVFVANAAGQPPMLWVRALSSTSARALPGSEQASYPFWSPDSRTVGFFASGKLKTAATSGDTPVIVCDAPTGRGGTWNAAGVIVFTSGIQDPLRKVMASGGTPEAVTAVDVPRENSHRWPQFLADGKHILFWAGAGTSPPQLKIGSLESRDSVLFGPADANGGVAAGYVFYKTGNSLMAQKFDVSTLTKNGDPIKVVEPISSDAGSAFASFSAAASGALLYTRGTALPLVLTWFDRSGKVLGTVGPPGQYTNVTLSPDDTRAAVSLTAGTPPNRDVWVIDLKNGSQTRVTTEAAVDATPVWSPDGTEIVYSSQRAGPYQMYRQAATGTTPAQLLVKAESANIATDWSADGASIAYTRTGLVTTPGIATGLDVWILPLSNPATPRRFVETSAAEDNGAFSPDGKWIAYQSNESGRDEIYIAMATTRVQTSIPIVVRGPMPGMRAPAVAQISRAGGTQPRWRGDGKELFFLGPDGAVMSAIVTSLPGFEAPQRILPSMTTLVIRHSYTVTKDGQRFLIPIIDQSNPPVITAVANWPATGK